MSKVTYMTARYRGEVCRIEVVDLDGFIHAKAHDNVFIYVSDADGNERLVTVSKIELSGFEVTP